MTPNPAWGGQPPQSPAYSGLLLVDKPVGISSFDVIRQLRRITGFRKIGHAGTLDPAASGLMLMLFGPACKQAAQFSKLDKRYAAEVTLGAQSSTGDREGVLTPGAAHRPSEADIRAALVRLTGEITQAPPVYSAIKIHGQEAYKRARAGEVVEMPLRRVVIYENSLVRYGYPLIELNCRVSSGTYIRTVAEDLGKLLGTGAYLSALVRTQVANFDLDKAVKLDELTAEAVSAQLIIP